MKKSGSSKSRHPRRSSAAPLALHRLVKVRWLPEPNLVFANSGQSTDPKEGLSLYGPFGLSTGEHPETIRVGIVGNDVTIGLAQGWLQRCMGEIGGVSGKRRQFPDFLGFNPETPFLSRFVFNSGWNTPVTQRELAGILGTSDKVKAFEDSVELFASKVKLVADLNVDVVICALPQEIEDYCSSIGPEEVRSSQSGNLSPSARAIRRVLREAERRGQLSFWSQLFPEETSNAPALLNRNFRRALKAKTNHFKCPVQIFRQRSLTDDDPRIQDPATRAWNSVVGLYFKARGRPWQVDGLDADTCYVGISFYHQITAESHTVHSSLAQLFTHQGENLVLRGQKFDWDTDKQGRQPHLTFDYARSLTAYILNRYRDYKGHYPVRVVIHKTSIFWDEERGGFLAGLSDLNISKYDLLALDQSGARFFREGTYPPVRGTWCQIGETGHFLYTTGYLPTQGTYPRSHVPKPYQIMDRHGDSPPETLLKEILALSKMNWNSAEYASAVPITLLFAHRVGEILAYLPEDVEPNQDFRFYC